MIIVTNVKRKPNVVEPKVNHGVKDVMKNNDFVGKNCALCHTYPPHDHLEFDGDYLCGSCALEVYDKVRLLMEKISE